MSAPGSPRHLIGRFFGSLRARRPSPADQAWIAPHLSPAESGLFWAQPVMDQRHALDTARGVATLSADPALVVAALLHDVGKRHSRTGVIGRSAASLLALARIPVRGRWRAYLDHGALGARDLGQAGSSPLTVSFAEHHHGERPDQVEAEVWAVLTAVDGE